MGTCSQAEIIDPESWSLGNPWINWYRGCGRLLPQSHSLLFLCTLNVSQAPLHYTWLCDWVQPMDYAQKHLDHFQAWPLDSSSRSSSMLFLSGRNGDDTQGKAFIHMSSRWLHWEGHLGFMTSLKKWKCYSLTCVWLSVTPWTAACQAPLSVKFFRQEYWRGLLFPSPGDLPDPGIEPGSPTL